MIPFLEIEQGAGVSKSRPESEYNLQVRRTEGENVMGPIGCLFMLVAQIFHMIIMIIMLPFLIVAGIISYIKGEK